MSLANTSVVLLVIALIYVGSAVAFLAAKPWLVAPLSIASAELYAIEARQTWRRQVRGRRAHRAARAKQQ